MHEQNVTGRKASLEVAPRGAREHVFTVDEAEKTLCGEQRACWCCWCAIFTSHLVFTLAPAVLNEVYLYNAQCFICTSVLVSIRRDLVVPTRPRMVAWLQASDQACVTPFVINVFKMVAER